MFLWRLVCSFYKENVEKVVIGGGCIICLVKSENTKTLIFRG
jgi:hypothetical protein